VSRDLILAHDLGTTGNKATLVRVDGTLVGSTFQGYETVYPAIGWAEQDPEDWWEAFRATTARLMRESGADPARVAAVSFSGQMMGCLPVDRTGTPLRSAIIWADQRSLEEAAWLADRVGEGRVYAVTGHRISPTYSVEKLLWVRAHEPDVFARTHKVLHAKDFVRLRLTGRAETDYSDASSMNLFDLGRRDWSDEILDAVGLPREILPEVGPSTKVVGEIDKKTTADLGLRAGTPVVMGGGDGPCAAVGAGVVAEGSAYNYIGSSSWIALATRRPVFDPARRTFTFWHLDPDMVMPTGTMQSAGGSYQWMRNQLCPLETAEAQRLGVSPYDLMNRQAEAVPAGCRGLLFLPYLMGERSPHWNPAARGVFLGLTLSHGRADMIRAVLEGVAFNLRIILDAFLRQGVRVPSIRVIGGGAKSALWCQILADVMNRTIERLTLLEEATSLGAAIAGGVGTGVFPDFSVAAAIVRIAESYRPRPEVRDVYDQQYEVFQDAYRALAPIYGRLQALPQQELA
jgi:xylulokinase